MAIKALDSWAILAFLLGEPAGEEVEKLLLRAEKDHVRHLMCAVNWGEVYYSILKAETRERADRVAEEIATMAIEIIPVGTDLDLARQAAVFKAGYRLSYADCFAAAVSKLYRVELVTGDPEFKTLEKELPRIHWLPR